MIRPNSINELIGAVQAHDKVIPVGAQTKRRLSSVSGDFQLLDMTGLSGITQYDPSEYTFSAWAGTPVAEVQAALNAKGQYMPFAPLLRDKGSTIGGVVAAGLSGAGRFRYGGVRDFLLGTHFIDSRGVQLKSGGKVVKNAAGFDISKFLVGSLGRMGILTEVTFKVFPGSMNTRTIEVPCNSHEEAAQRTMAAGNSSWDLSALDYSAEHKSLYLRVSGPAQALDQLEKSIIDMWGGSTLLEENCVDFWTGIRELDWASNAYAIVKTAVHPSLIPTLQANLNTDTCVHYSGGGTVAAIAAKSASDLDGINTALKSLKLSGIVFIGPDDCPLWVGHQRDRSLLHRLKDEFDPNHKFADFHYAS